MKIPNARIAKVERRKISEYLLNSGHRYGAGKARFFTRCGFTLADWEALSLGLSGHGRQNEVTKVTETAYGPRYEVEGELQTPDGRTPGIRTVWQLDRGMVAPRLITACLGEDDLMINEHECVALTEDLDGEGLKAGDIGTVVHIHPGGAAYEVEFATLAGETIAVTTLSVGQVRPLAKHDMAHARARSPEA